MRNNLCSVLPLLLLFIAVSAFGETIQLHPVKDNTLYEDVPDSSNGAGLDRSVVARYTVSAGDPDTADAASAFTLLEFEQDAGNHNGGDLHFGGNFENAACR